MIAKLITGFLARFTISLFRHPNPDKKQEFTAPDKVIINDGRTRCPECGAPYDIKDYRDDVAKIFCSTCKAQLNKIE
ncbi:MAG: hypothetical protein WC959_09410 [Kiritimatiellales bacterium]